jgi:pimeloyl-ACP methyl ester carboxylesterase
MGTPGTTIDREHSEHEHSEPSTAGSGSSGRARRPRAVGRAALRWSRRGLLILLAAVIAATVAGQIQQFRLQRAHPPIGDLIDVGGHRLHVLRSDGRPTVVFENGPGGMAVDWAWVQSEIAQTAGTFAYDRAGLGWSEPGSGPRDISTLVNELHEALQASGSQPPYVLVGHSYGGLIVRAYAYTYPSEVAGLVLVDAAHEDQFDVYPEAYVAKAERMARSMGRLRSAFRAVSGSGVPALLGSAFPDAVADRLPENLGAARRAATAMDSSHATATTDEMLALADSLDQVRRLRAPLDDLPVAVITHGRPLGSDAGVPPGLENEVERAWRRMQDDLTRISTDSRLIVAADSGHDIHLDRPDVVTAAIEDVLDRVERDR